MRLSNQLLQEYRERASLGEDAETALVRLHAEKIPLIQVIPVLTGIYNLHFNEAMQRINACEYWRYELHPSDILVQLVDEYRERSEEGENIEQAIIRLHEQNVNAGDAVKTLRAVYDLKLGEARDLLFDHPVWSKERLFSENMLEQFFSAEDIAEDINKL